MCATLGKERVEVAALVSNCKCVLVLAEYRIVVWFLASLLFFVRILFPLIGNARRYLYLKIYELLSTSRQ
jgi:hypothetical protein